MIKKLILFSLNLLILVIGVLWYFSEKSYEPLIVITGSIISLLSFSGVFSSSFDELSEIILDATNTHENISNRMSIDIINSSKKFDSFVFYIKRITSYLTSILIIVSIFQISIVSSELNKIPNNEVIKQLEIYSPEQPNEIKKEDHNYHRSLLFFMKLFDSKYSLLFIILSLFTIMMHMLFLDMINRFIYSSYAKKLDSIRDEDQFIKECKDINSALLHYEFKNKDIPEMLRLSITQAFSDFYLNNIKLH